MDKIKTVKIKNEDGTVSQESYYISADARNIDMTNGYNVQETIGNIDIDNNGNIAEQLENLNNDIKKKAYFFNTIADMKAADLKIGDYACTLGYYEVNDGGAAEYRIISGNYIDDGGSYHKLNNNLFAELIINNEINVLTYGIKTGTTETQSQLDALLLAIANGSSSIYFPSGIYRIANTIYLPTKTQIRGDGGGTVLQWYGEEDAFMFNILSGRLNCMINNLCIDGRGIGAGIYDCDKTYSTSSGTRSKIYNLRLDNMKLGIYMNAMGSEFYNIYCMGQLTLRETGNTTGFLISGTDNFINSCRIGRFTTGLIITGANNRLLTIKSCTNGIGIYLNSGDSGFYNIDLQENLWDNLICENTTQATIIMSNENAGITKNAYLDGDDLQYSLVKMLNCKQVSIEGTLGARTLLGSDSHGNEKYALYIDDQCTGIIGSFQYHYRLRDDTAVLTKPIFYCKDTENNKITVNNKILTSSNVWENLIITDLVSTTAAISTTSDGNNLIMTYDSSKLNTDTHTGLFSFDGFVDSGFILAKSNDMYLKYITLQVYSSETSKSKEIRLPNPTTWLNANGSYICKIYYEGSQKIINDNIDIINEALEGGAITRVRMSCIGFLINPHCTVSWEKAEDPVMSV